MYHFSGFISLHNPPLVIIQIHSAVIGSKDIATEKEDVNISISMLEKMETKDWKAVQAVEEEITEAAVVQVEIPKVEANSDNQEVKEATKDADIPV